MQDKEPLQKSLVDLIFEDMLSRLEKSEVFDNASLKKLELLVAEGKLKNRTQLTKVLKSGKEHCDENPRT